MTTNLFSFTLLSKNAPANHLVSHSCKNTGLKVPCFHTLTKKGVGEGSRISCFDFRVSSPNFRLSTVACQLSRLSPLTSALTSKRASKSFRCNTYEKHTGGEGGTRPRQPYFRLSTVACQLSWLSPLTSTLTNFASVTPLTSTLTKTKDLKSFIINTYKKGVGVHLLSTLNSRLSTHESPVTSHE